MNYCKSCILPDSRPNLSIGDDGVCNACRSHATKKEIDWKEREVSFKEVVKNAKALSSGYDCLIPVSGGKDSTWQVLKCLEYGLNPLCVTWRTPARTGIGQKNLDNLISLGVDHLDFSINPKVEKYFVSKSLEKFGTTALPMHMAIFSIPQNVAINYRIPLIIWGENSAFEYGNSDEETTGFKLDEKWLKYHGVTNGTSAKDWIDDVLTEKKMAPYYLPDQVAIDNAGVLACFLGYYFEWDPVETFRVAEENGFQSLKDTVKTGYYGFADIDDAFIISVHHWFKWYKFGFTRLWDNLSLEIRNNRMTREEAIDVINTRGSEEPNEDIEMLCEYLNISRDKFDDIADRHRNQMIWSKKQGKWEIDSFLLPDWKW